MSSEQSITKKLESSELKLITIKELCALCKVKDTADLTHCFICCINAECDSEIICKEHEELIKELERNKKENIKKVNKLKRRLFE
jgi:hypothetical protein